MSLLIVFALLLYFVSNFVKNNYHLQKKYFTQQTNEIKTENTVQPYSKKATFSVIVLDTFIVYKKSASQIKSFKKFNLNINKIIVMKPVSINIDTALISDNIKKIVNYDSSNASGGSFIIDLDCYPKDSVRKSQVEVYPTYVGPDKTLSLMYVRADFYGSLNYQTLFGKLQSSLSKRVSEMQGED